jgi:hypothetical protein
MHSTGSGFCLELRGICLLRVEKRVLRPGHNAINVYHVDIHRMNKQGDSVCHPNTQTTNPYTMLRSARVPEKTPSASMAFARFNETVIISSLPPG